ncbi:NAD(P)/FAD-dependent oxidoreductase [Desertivirga brevis]|uniref:NAD(P)/FAD-dependent oxidoreductase n=1 Tax=Desertivirga brevis TaxID=2810310 RepID=UPI001A96AB06|nr:FAD-dependent oxidoreductase [Pedobacter sp. SYSU D00873]
MNSKITRRKLLKFGLGASAMTALESLIPADGKAQAPAFIRQTAKNGKIVVVGAGAFGGWTALHLQRKGYEVTLVDQFGAGNNQSSSGGETRLIRPYYDNQQVYFDLVLRSIQLWKDNEPLFRKKVLHQNGLLLLHQNTNVPHEETALNMYRKAGLEIQRISPAEAAKRWPQINTNDLDHVIYDPNSGYLEAREGCSVVAERFQEEGGKYLHQQVLRPLLKGGRLNSVTLSNGTILEADAFVFAGGPWLTRLFPDITRLVKITRQGYFYFATPPEASDLWENCFPNWVDLPLDNDLSYGIPGNANRGFKVAITINDDITSKFDTYNRFLKPEELLHAQKILLKRFPKLAHRPLIEQRICQYTETPDKNFILDTHPEAANLWLLGGGSGHGYKHGAALGELAAENLLGEKEKLELFAVKRLLS